MRLFFLILSLIFISSCASLTRDEEAARLHHQIGVGHLESGNYPQALSELLAAEKLDSTNPFVQNSLGLVYFYRDRFELSEKHFRKALSINNSFSEARSNLSQILIERGKYKEALREAETVVSDLTYTQPEKAYLHLGIAYFMLGKYEAAKAPLLKSIEIKRDNCPALSYYGRAFYELKDFRRSSDTLDKAVSYCQKELFDEPHYYSGLSYYQLGNVVKSESRLEEVIKLYPNGKYVDRAKSMLETIRR